MLKNKHILLCEQAKENWNRTGRQNGSQQPVGWHVAQIACTTQEPKKSLKDNQSEVKKSSQRITEPEAICPANFAW